MNFLLENWMLLCVALASGVALMLPALTKGNGLDPQGMVQLMNREKAVVIDVCEPDEFARGHVIGAKNLPVGEKQIDPGGHGVSSWCPFGAGRSCSAQAGL